jgi:hypothetical protein
LQTQRNRFATPRDRSANAAQSLCKRSAIALQMLRNRSADTAQSLCKRRAIALQTLRIRFVNVSQSLCKRCAITLQTLRYHCATLIHAKKIKTHLNMAYLAIRFSCKSRQAVDQHKYELLSETAVFACALRSFGAVLCKRCASCCIFLNSSCRA